MFFYVCLLVINTLIEPTFSFAVHVVDVNSSPGGPRRKRPQFYNVLQIYVVVGH